MPNAGSLIPVKSAGCGPLAKGFYDKGLLQNEYHMKAGDVVFFNWDGGASPSSWVPFPSVDHVGIVITAPDSNGYFTSIEGNTGSSAYGQVQVRTRNICDVSCSAHPQYTSKITKDMIIATAKKEEGTTATAIKRCKYNTWYWGSEVSGWAYDWCAAFVCWVFYHTEVKDGDVKKLCDMKMQCCGEGYTSRVGVVKNVQRILKMCNGYTITKIDGNDKTEEFKNAIKRYQKKFGLKQTGVCDANTLKSIFSCE